MKNIITLLATAAVAALSLNAFAQTASPVQSAARPFGLDIVDKVPAMQPLRQEGLESSMPKEVTPNSVPISVHMPTKREHKCSATSMLGLSMMWDHTHADALSTTADRPEPRATGTCECNCMHL